MNNESDIQVPRKVTQHELDELYDRLATKWAKKMEQRKKNK